MIFRRISATGGQETAEREDWEAFDGVQARCLSPKASLPCTSAPIGRVSHLSGPAVSQ